MFKILITCTLKLSQKSIIVSIAAVISIYTKKMKYKKLIDRCFTLNFIKLLIEGGPWPHILNFLSKLLLYLIIVKEI